MKDLTEYFQQQRSQTKKEDLIELWNKLEDLHRRRLWHQLTLHLFELVARADMQDENKLVNLYQNFISDFENKINALSLIEICTPIVNQIKDKEEAIQFIEKVGEKIKNKPEAHALTRVIVGKIRLHHFKQPDETKGIVEEIENILSEVTGVGKVHSEYYRLASDLYKVQGKHAEYYRSALKFLGCTELTSLTMNERQVQAFELGLAAILGKGIYNFGELLAHPILESLKNTEEQWLVQLLYAFNSGNVREYEKLKPRWEKQADLNSNQSILLEKICLLALMEMAFQRPSTERQLSFREIATQTTLPENQVELLVMKALAQGLVKGEIDQVAGTVNLTWVQPRVLDVNQLKSIITKIDMWCAAVNSMELMIEQNASEILTN